MKLLLLDLATRVIVILIFFLFPVVAIAGAPWALYDSAGTWGHTTWHSWLEGWRIYSPSSLRGAWRELTKPLPKK